MIDTARLHPPGFGPTANPLLFGIAEGLSRLFPLPEAGPAPTGQTAPASDEDADAARETALVRKA